jgi:hypothetical protein
VSSSLYMGAWARRVAPALLLAGLMAAAAGDDSTAPTPDPGAVPEAAPPEPPAPVRISSSFEVKHAAAVLRQVAKLYSAGFVRKDADRVAAEIDVMPAEVTRAWDFNAVHKGTSYPLRVRARLDDFGNLDLDFFSAPEMAPAVRRALDRYLSSHGL